jgi:hypothetical protein
LLLFQHWGNSPGPAHTSCDTGSLNWGELLELCQALTSQSIKQHGPLENGRAPLSGNPHPVSTFFDCLFGTDLLNTNELRQF